MRHLLYWSLLGIALFVMLAFTLPFMMNECQLHSSQAAAERCFAANAVGFRVYGGSLVAFLGLSLWLYVKASRWALMSLIGVGVGPAVVATGIAALYRLI